jgi:peptidoglycan hydrolase-like protein with peptidoglycan-binding domain
MKTQHWILIVAVVVLIIVGVLTFDAWGAKGVKHIPADNGGDSTGRKGCAFPLGVGSSGICIEKLQQFLNESGSYGLAIDGQFGPKTLAAVKSELGKSTVDEDYFMTFVA